MKQILVFQTFLLIVSSASSSLSGFLEDEDFQLTFPHASPLITSKGESYYLYTQNRGALT